GDRPYRPAIASGGVADRTLASDVGAGARLRESVHELLVLAADARQLLAHLAKVGGPARARFADRLGVIEVARVFGEQEYVLVGSGRPVSHRFGQRVWLGPDQVGAQIPAVGLEGERHPPGDAHQVLRLELRR